MTMATSLDATRALRDAAARAYLAGDPRRAYDLVRCDYSGRPAPFDQFVVAFARELVSSDPRRFAEALLKQGYDEAPYHPLRTACRDALEKLEAMEPSDVLSLEYALLRAAPHTLACHNVTGIVFNIMGRT